MFVYLSVCSMSPTYAPPCFSASTPIAGVDYHTPTLSVPTLPLRLLGVQKRLQDGNQLLERRQPSRQFGCDLLRVFTELNVEILAVRTRTHRGAENRLHHEGVVRFERAAVRGPEGDAEFFGYVGEVLGEG